MLLTLLLLSQTARVHGVDSMPGALYKLLRQLTPVEKGCKASAGTKITSSAPSARADPAFCETSLPKLRQCVVYSFGVGRTGWDLDKALASDGRCRVKSFDPACCGGSHSIPYHTASASHDFVPLVLAPSDGLVVGTPATGNITAAGLTLKSLMAGFGDGRASMGQRARRRLSSAHAWQPWVARHSQVSRGQATGRLATAVDARASRSRRFHRLLTRRQARCAAAERLEPLRVEGASPNPDPNLNPNYPRPSPALAVTRCLKWQALRSLVDTPGVLKAVPQLLLGIHFSEPSRYDDYVDVLQALKALGFLPFYVARQPSAQYLQIQVGESQLWSSYEVGLGNVRL